MPSPMPNMAVEVAMEWRLKKYWLRATIWPEQAKLIPHAEMTNKHDKTAKGMTQNDKEGPDDDVKLIK